MANNSNRRIAFLILVFVFIALFSGCKKKAELVPAVSHFTAGVNQEGDVLAFLVGVGHRGGPGGLDAQPVLVYLDEAGNRECFQRHDDWVLNNLCWRPGSESVLSYFTFERIYGTLSEGKFYEAKTNRWSRLGPARLVQINTDQSRSTSQALTLPDHFEHITRLAWSPDGKIITAALRLRDDSLKESEFQNKLIISYDEGKTFYESDFPAFGRAYWLNNHEFYIMSDFEDAIARVDCKGQKLTMTEVLAQPDFSIVLAGVFLGEPVYMAYPQKIGDEYIHKSRRFFVGNCLFYETDNHICIVRARRDHLALEADGKVIIFDENLSVTHKRPLKKGTQLFTFHPETGRIFLVKNWQTILCYDMENPEDVREIFSMDMLK